MEASRCGRTAVEVFHGFEQREIFLQGDVVGVVRILLDTVTIVAGNETGKIIYVAGSIVPAIPFFSRDLSDTE